MNLCILILVCSCSNRDTILQKVKQMKETPITIPLGKMVYWEPEENEDEKLKDRDYRLVVFADSAQCTPCFISHLSEWYEFLSLEREGKLNVTFIIEPKTALYDETIERINKVQFLHPLYIDSNYQFRKSNPKIPEESMYHVFLLNKNNQIVLVGNPLHNKQIEEMIIEITKK